MEYSLSPSAGLFQQEAWRGEGRGGVIKCRPLVCVAAPYHLVWVCKSAVCVSECSVCVRVQCVCRSAVCVCKSTVCCV